MSSSSYSATLTPDPWLRIAVLISGQLLVAAGLGLILTLDMNAGLRLVMSLVWVVAGRFELGRLQQGFDACTAIRVFQDGSISLLNEHREWTPATLQTGSVLLQGQGWLRLRTENGQYFHELVCGDARQSQNWRRLQVIWRHIGAAG